MKKLFLVLLLAGMLSGCAHHYYRFDDTGVTIYLKAPDAASVSFASSLDGFVLHPATKIDKKTWVYTLPDDRQFSYFYVIDGAVFVPECDYRENDDFGSANCVFIPGM
jgi:hypothetical protein